MWVDGKKQFGERVRRARCDANLTQAMLAQRLGISQGVISNVETGVSAIDAPDVPEWAAALEKPILYFFLDVETELLEEAWTTVCLFPEAQRLTVLRVLQAVALTFGSEKT